MVLLAGDTVVKSAVGTLPRPGAVAVFPFAGQYSRKDLVSLEDGCRAGIAAAGVTVIAPERVAAAMAERGVVEAKDREVAQLGKLLGADAVIIGALDVGHFASGVDARFILTETGTVAATARTESSAAWFELAKQTCRAFVTAQL